MRGLLIVLVFIWAGAVRAAQDAHVIVEKAVIWADVEQKSPLGYLGRGKLLRVGEISRNHGKVVPVVVSGRIAYVALSDITLGETTIDGRAKKQYSRFQDLATQDLREQVVLSGTQMNMRESKDTAHDRPGDNWQFQGGTLKGEARIPGGRTGLGVMFDYLYAKNGSDYFRVFDFGMGLTYAVVDSSRFKIKTEAWGLLIPWIQYEHGKFFSLNGWGAGALFQVSAMGMLTQSWGLELTVGEQVIKAYGIKPPSPYKAFNPFFMGTRISLGVVYRF